MARIRALPVNGVNMAPEILLESKSLRKATAGDVAFESMLVYLYVLALANVNSVSLVSIWVACLLEIATTREFFWARVTDKL